MIFTFFLFGLFSPYCYVVTKNYTPNQYITLCFLCGILSGLNAAEEGTPSKSDNQGRGVRKFLLIIIIILCIEISHQDCFLSSQEQKIPSSLTRVKALQ